MTDNTLSLFQLCDSNFPTGSFSQSFGLETYIQKDLVHDATSFVDWLKVYVDEQLSYVDGLASKMVYEALADGNIEKVWEIDRLLHVQNLARETREGTQRMGESMLRISKDIYDIPLLSTYQKQIKAKRAYGHPAVAFTIVGYHLDIDQSTTILYYLYSTIVGLIQNAVRAIPLGQTEGQKVTQAFVLTLHKTTDKILQLDNHEFGIISPGIELAQMQHEHVGIRIFSS